MKLIVDFNIICEAPGSRAYVYAMLRKEFETDLLPMVGMQLEDPAWKEPRPIKNVIINPEESYYLVYIGTDNRPDEDQCEQLKQMHLQHGWQRPASLYEDTFKGLREAKNISQIVTDAHKKTED